MAETEHSIRDLCLAHTDLMIPDIIILENMVNQLPVIATLTGTDIFIDALTVNQEDAIVLAWASSPNSPSLYRNSVVGELAYAACEPAVYQAFSTGQSFYNIRGVSQEGVPIAQTVVPLTNDNGQVIGVLIMEKDISKEIRQEQQVQLLSQTAEHLSHTLMSLRVTGYGWEEWLGNGVFILNDKGKIVYANKQAMCISKSLYEGDTMDGNLMLLLSFASLPAMVEGLKNPRNYEFDNASYLFQAHPLLTGGELNGCVLSFQDVTELRQKERQLGMQNIIIQEINHRVKNTLQNVISLLRLQMRRSKWKAVRREFTATINRILSIAKVYEIFTYQYRDLVNLHDLAEYILEQVVQSYILPEQKVKTMVQGQAVLIHASQAVPVALVLNELVANSLVHGIKADSHGEISIIVKESGANISVEVRDSGCGLWDYAAISKGGTLGLYIVKLLICEQLGGTFQFENCGQSVVANISFPVHKKEETG
ncbi:MULTISPECIES: sensor histidine kinase [Pelosinus]|uniref:histidine kinase n=1 Tax=Pelosinus fermentans B4 TaxID=1149862 RepID=I8RHQ7_9FIRM|nr:MULTISPECIES: sensor histidine kinase [Pelosinus]EIW17485.1 Signal transduction histidine kinase [Pelosinus fermentans B4]EIW23545.1 signal transduction histidine kinase [Pelosinus fermentans A11]OAM92040.1 signal transduction histidine kinase [Pelosinus fermentans DSM 17108]SDQ31699.1 Two-component sensor histidine kinase, contains HisKA and HATPase domains [Pelosinus fermentans]